MTARALTTPFDTPPSPKALMPAAATQQLVQRQVDALLSSTPSFHELSRDGQDSVSRNLVNIASYAAECMRDICWQSDRLGQVPVLRQRSVAEPVARAQEAGQFQPQAANQVGRITQETLRAVAFPTFVADLIHGTFNAITQSNIQQMEAFTSLLENVGKTVDSFMQSNVSDDQARGWLASRYPQHIRVDQGRLTVAGGAEERPAPSFRADLNLESDVSLDEGALEETLLPAARRRLAESRLQMLSTMVLMGFSRIIVTGGKIRATMGFHIDTSDRSHEESASDLDFRLQAQAQGGFGLWSVSASTSLSYVSSRRASSDAEINTETDLTGEVELHFKSDYFPLSRFANGAAIGRIQANTAVPEANAVSAEAGGPFDAPPAVGGDVQPFTSPRTHRAPRQQPQLRAIGSPLPEARRPDAVTPVTPRPQQPHRTETPPAQTEAPHEQPAGDANAQQPAADQPPAGEAAQAATGGRVWRARP